MSGVEAECQRAGPKLVSCLWPLLLYVFLLSGKLQSKVMKSKVLGEKRKRLSHRTALLAGRARLLLARLGRVRVLLWYCRNKKQEKLKMIFNHFTIAVFFVVFFFFKVVFFVSKNTHRLCESSWPEQPPTHFVPVAKNKKTKKCQSRQKEIRICLFFLKKKVFRVSADRGGEPLQSFHLEDLAADVSVALRVLLWPAAHKQINTWMNQ